MRNALILFCALSVSFVGCSKKKPLPPLPPTGSVPEKKRTPPPAVKAPRGVPQNLKDKVEREWPTIEREGKAFLAKFQEAQGLRSDRSRLGPVIDQANKHFQNANDKWGALYSSIYENDWSDDVVEKCEKFLSKYNRQVTEWIKKNKALKEFSTVK